MTIHLRDADRGDFEAILALNHASVHFLSPLDAQRLARLHAMASCHRVADDDGRVCAFLLVLAQGQPYDSPNYRWFAGRYERFLYVDRVVVDPACQGQGIGPRLYQELFAFAQRTGAPRITLEIDSDPPNPVSTRFHAHYGFAEVGTHRVAGGTKRVSLQSLELSGAPGARQH